MTRLDMWSRVLSSADLLALREDCSPYHGDVIAWADMYRGLRGQLQISQLELCRSCTEPEAPNHGDVRLEGNYGQYLYSTVTGRDISAEPATRGGWGSND
jgi:hypothetical protein